MGPLVIGVIGSLIVAAGGAGIHWLYGAIRGSNRIEDLLDELCRNRPERVSRGSGLRSPASYSIILTPSQSSDEWAIDAAYITCHRTSVTMSLMRDRRFLFRNQEITYQELIDLLRQHQLAILRQAGVAPGERYA